MRAYFVLWHETWVGVVSVSSDDIISNTILRSISDAQGARTYIHVVTKFGVFWLTSFSTLKPGGGNLSSKPMARR